MAISTKDLTNCSQPFTDFLFGDNIKDNHASAIRNFKLTHSVTKRAPPTREGLFPTERGVWLSWSPWGEAFKSALSKSTSSLAWVQPQSKTWSAQPTKALKPPRGKERGLRWTEKICVKRFLDLPLPHIPVGGRLQFFRKFWCKFTHDLQILQMITGMPLDLARDVPRTSLALQLILSDEETLAADHEVAQLLNKKAIEICSNEDKNQFMNNIFLIPKKNSESKFHLILNLKKFNFFISKIMFKMETLNSMLDLVQKDFWLSSLDLLDAYLVIPILPSHTSYLKFKWRHVVYKFLVMAFDYSVAPRRYTKLLRVVLSWLRRLGHFEGMYLDDSLQTSKSYQGCLNSKYAVHNMLVSRGFMPNYRKSHLQPTQVLTILSFIVDSISMTITLPCDKIEKMLSLVNNAL